MKTALDILRDTVDKEITEFRNSYNDTKRINRYEDYYIIGFYEEHYELLMSNYAERRITDKIAKWLSKSNRPLGFLYDRWAKVDGKYSHCREVLMEFIIEEWEDNGKRRRD